MKRFLMAALLIVSGAVRAEIRMSDFATPYFSLESDYASFASRYQPQINAISESVFRFKAFNLYVEGEKITAFEILEPDATGFAGVYVGSHERDVVLKVGGVVKDNTFEREGPYDRGFKDYDYVMVRDYVYDSLVSGPESRVRWIVFFIKNATVNRILIYQGGRC